MYFLDLQEVYFNTFDGVPDKHRGRTISVTPMPWNRASRAGTPRRVNFQVTTKSGDANIRLLSINLNGGEDNKYI